MSEVTLNGTVYSADGRAGGADLRGPDGYGHVTAMLPMMQDLLAEVGLQKANVVAVANAIAALAAASAATAQQSAAAAALSGNASLWVSGSNYADRVVVISPKTQRQYRRRSAGAGTLDPADDPSNWAALALDIATGLPRLRPTVNLQFDGRWPSFLRMQRATGGMSQRRDASWREVGPNVPRWALNAVGMLCPLVEEARTNLLWPSADLAAWSAGALADATVTVNTGRGLDGSTLTADTLDDSDAAATRGKQRAVAVTAAAGYLCAWALLRDATAIPSLRLTLNSTTPVVTECAFDLAAQTWQWRRSADGVTPGTAAGCQRQPDGSTLVWMTIARANAGETFANVELRPAFNRVLADTLDASATGSVSVLHTQVEYGAEPSSPITTTTAAVQRSADVPDISGQDFTDLWPVTEGTVVVGFSRNVPPANATSVSSFVFAASDGTGINTIASAGLFSTPQQQRVFIYAGDGSVPQALISASSTVDSGRQRLAFSYKRNALHTSQNGQAVVSDTQCDLPAVLNRLYIGASPTGNVGGLQRIESLQIYPVAVDPAFLPALSTVN